MATIAALSDQELEELLAGRTPEGLDDLASLADLAGAVRQRREAEPVPVMGYSLRRALCGPSIPAARHRSLAGLVAAAIGIVAFGAASAANALPAPIQNAVAEASGIVGVQVPHAGSDDLAAIDEPPARVAGFTEAEDEGNEAKVANPPDATPGGATPATPPEPSTGTDGTGSDGAGGHVGGTIEEDAGTGGDKAHDNAGDGAGNGEDKADNAEDRADDDEDDDGSADGTTDARGISPRRGR